MVSRDDLRLQCAMPAKVSASLGVPECSAWQYD